MVDRSYRLRTGVVPPQALCPGLRDRSHARPAGRRTSDRDLSVPNRGESGSAARTRLARHRHGSTVQQSAAGSPGMAPSGPRRCGRPPRRRQPTTCRRNTIAIGGNTASGPVVAATNW